MENSPVRSRPQKSKPGAAARTASGHGIADWASQFAFSAFSHSGKRPTCDGTGARASFGSEHTFQGKKKSRLETWKVRKVGFIHFMAAEETVVSRSFTYGSSVYWSSTPCWMDLRPTVACYVWFGSTESEASASFVTFCFICVLSTDPPPFSLSFSLSCSI